MKQITYVQAIAEALAEEMERDEKVYMIGEDIQQGTFGASAGLVKKFRFNHFFYCGRNGARFIFFLLKLIGNFAPLHQISFNRYQYLIPLFHFFHIC